MIVAMLAGSLFAMLLATVFGANKTGIGTVGALPTTLPPLSAPQLSVTEIKQLAPAVMAVTLLALTEAVSIARSIAVRSGQHINSNQEFMGQGLSNIAGSFFSSYVATGSFNRTGVNYEAGAKTPLAAVFAGILLIGVLLSVAPLAAYLPNAVMAGILMLVAWGLIDFHHIANVLRTSRSDSVVLVTTFVATLFLELEFAILLGVGLSLVLYLKRTAHPRIVRRVPDPYHPRRKFSGDIELPECPQLKIVRLDGSLFFGAVNHVRQQLHTLAARNPAQKHLMIVASGINFVDVAGAEFLAQEAQTRRDKGGGLYLVRMKRGVSEPIQRGHYLEKIGDDNIFPERGEAIEKIFKRLDRDICSQCRLRIFKECQALPPPKKEP